MTVRQRQFSLHVESGDAPAAKRKGAGEPMVNRAFLVNQQVNVANASNNKTHNHKRPENEGELLGALVITNANTQNANAGLSAHAGAAGAVAVPVLENAAQLRGGFEAYVTAQKLQEEVLYETEGESAVVTMLSQGNSSSGRRELLQGGVGLSLGATDAGTIGRAGLLARPKTSTGSSASKSVGVARPGTASALQTSAGRSAITAGDRNVLNPPHPVSANPHTSPQNVMRPLNLKAHVVPSAKLHRNLDGMGSNDYFPEEYYEEKKRAEKEKAGKDSANPK